MADGNARGFSSADKYVFLEIKCGSKTSLKALSYTKHSGSYGTGTTKISRFGSDVYIFGEGGKRVGEFRLQNLNFCGWNSHMKVGILLLLLTAGLRENDRLDRCLHHLLKPQQC